MNFLGSAAVDCIALNGWGKHKRKIGNSGRQTNGKATSSNRAPSTSSLYYY